MKPNNISQPFLLLLIMISLAFFSISSGQNLADKVEKEETEKKVEKEKIYVSVPPLAFFVEQITSPNFEIVTVIGPGQSPATYETTPKRLAQFAKAKLFFTAGVPFEKHLNKKLKSSFANLNLIDTQKRIELINLEHHHHHGDIDNNEEKAKKANNESNSLDPHTWLDPSLAKIISQNIYDGLIKSYPSDSLVYQNNLNLLMEDLDRLDAFLRQQLEPYTGMQFYCFHPAFGYFARAYDLKQVAIEVDGKEPSARQLTEIIKKAKDAKIKILFTQPQFSNKSAKAIAESVGARVIAIDPLAQDYINNLKEITNQLILAFKSLEINND